MSTEFSILNLMKNFFSKYYSYWILPFFLFFTSCNHSDEIIFNLDLSTPEVDYQIDSYSLLDSTLNANKFHMDSILLYKRIPMVYVDKIQPSISNLKIGEKKRNFIRILLSHTLKFNEQISKTRLDLIKTLNKPKYSSNDSLWLDSLSNIYRIKKKNYHQLIKKIDIIPPSLIIVQGIIESGWATSKYAVNDNNLFGLYGSRKVKTKDGRLRPRAKSFEDIETCVAEYITNLNRHFAYRRMREVRAEMRELGLTITGKKLASTLMNYSTLGERYVRKIVSMINLYKLEEFDQYTFIPGYIVHIQIKE